MTLATIIPSDWIANSGSSTHIAQNRLDFTNYIEDPFEIDVVAPGATLWTCGWGTVTIQFKVNNKIYTVQLHDVKYASEAPNNIISVGWLTDNGHFCNFTPTGVEFKSSSGTIFVAGQKIGRIHQMRAWTKPLAQGQDFAAVVTAHTYNKWHHILGHVHM